MVREVVPDAIGAVEPSARLLAFAFQPDAYTGIVAGLILHTEYVNCCSATGWNSRRSTPADCSRDGKKAR